MTSLHHIQVLTSNPKKTIDFQRMGFGVQPFDLEIPEILSPDVALVAVHKCKTANFPFGLVEDTALSVEGVPHFGTEIKHVWHSIEHNPLLHMAPAVWSVSLCVLMNDEYLISTSSTSGVLKYPLTTQGYHFDRVFAVTTAPNTWTHFEHLTPQEKEDFSPRFKAMRQLKNAITSHTFSDIQVIPASYVKVWDGPMQTDAPLHPLKSDHTYRPSL